ncbi:MAG: DUF4422 domain-containing protein [Muribaculaceae bacterium]|nr:DUF4422 domain-containing protein [Muribaculaceae bacterium]
MKSDYKHQALILVCCHKKDYFCKENGYFPIQVGAAISKIDLGIAKDNSGDNISEKNPNFCELTAHYWLWKNGPDSKYYGLNHYRRYFNFHPSMILPLSITNRREEEMIQHPPVIPDLDSIFKRYDIVVAKPLQYPYPLYMHYCAAHSKEDLLILEHTLNELYPEYASSFDEILKHSTHFSAYNMFIMPKDRFVHYSEWLFSILFEVEKRVKISNDPVQARVFGYMAERLLNVYVHHHHLKTKFLPIIKVSEEPKSSKFKVKMASLKNSLAEVLIKHTKLIPLK